MLAETNSRPFATKKSEIENESDWVELSENKIYVNVLSNNECYSGVIKNADASEYTGGSFVVNLSKVTDVVEVKKTPTPTPTPTKTQIEPEDAKQCDGSVVVRS